MITSEELLKYSNLGNRNEIGFVLFKALSPEMSHSVSDIIKFCNSHMFSIGFSPKGIIELLKFISIIKLDDGKISLNLSVFDPRSNNPDRYFSDEHFFRLLFTSLSRSGDLEELFNESNIKLSSKNNLFYIKSHLISIRIFPIRHLLISLKFLTPDKYIPNHLYISPQFTELFKSIIIENITKNISRKKRTLNQLKRSLEAKERAGKESELFVLNFEIRRLEQHPNPSGIIRISEEQVNAGYDIISYHDNTSVFNDRYIEVKSFSKNSSFFWSRNEVEVARDLGKQYCLYLVDRSKIEQPDYFPQIIENAYQRVFDSVIWERVAESWEFSIIKEI